MNAPQTKESIAKRGPVAAVKYAFTHWLRKPDAERAALLNDAMNELELGVRLRRALTELPTSAEHRNR